MGFISPAVTSTASHSLITDKPTISSPGSTYTWIWEEFENASGPIDGDDSVVWGASLGPYYNYSELTLKLRALENNFSQLVDLFSIGKSRDGRELWTLRLTNQSVTSEKTEFHLVAHHHAREVITIVNAMYFVDKLIYEATQANSTFTNFLTNCEIYVTPCLNPDGLEVMSWFPWMRKNRAPIDDDEDGTIDDETEIFDANGDGYVEKEGCTECRLGGVFYEGADGPDLDVDIGNDAPGGIDLNRNYGYEFIGSGSKNFTVSELYRGESAFSEPETQAIRDFTLQHDFRYAISLHSGVQAIIGPWGYTIASTPHEEHFNIITQRLKDITGYPTWSEIPSSYLVNGEWGDWMYGECGVFSFTLETYGDKSAYFNPRNATGYLAGVWDAFNPPANEALATSEPVWDALIYMLSMSMLEPPTDTDSSSTRTSSGGSNDTTFPIVATLTVLFLNGLVWKRRRQRREL